VERDAANHDALADSVIFGWVGLYLSALGQGTVHDHSARQSANAGGFGRNLRAVGERSGRRASRLRCDLDDDSCCHRRRLLRFRTPLRHTATVNLRHYFRAKFRDLISLSVTMAAFSKSNGNRSKRSEAQSRGKFLGDK